MSVRQMRQTMRRLEFIPFGNLHHSGSDHGFRHQFKKNAGINKKTLPTPATSFKTTVNGLRQSQSKSTNSRWQALSRSCPRPTLPLRGGKSGGRCIAHGKGYCPTQLHYSLTVLSAQAPALSSHPRALKGGLCRDVPANDLNLLALTAANSVINFT